mmetsp:Transcript_58464/g.181562  ORF Transcript_58464/g.181562 Transcript_58464/m.181562 type:complete len:259 (-) Transcript_58464:79-855(-)
MCGLPLLCAGPLGALHLGSDGPRDLLDPADRHRGRLHADPLEVRVHAAPQRSTHMGPLADICHRRHRERPVRGAGPQLEPRPRHGLGKSRRPSDLRAWGPDTDHERPGRLRGAERHAALPPLLGGRAAGARLHRLHRADPALLPRRGAGARRGRGHQGGGPGRGGEVARQTQPDLCGSDRADTDQQGPEIEAPLLVLRPSERRRLSRARLPLGRRRPRRRDVRQGRGAKRARLCARARVRACLRLGALACICARSRPA